MNVVTGRPHPDLERAFADTLARLKKADPLAPMAVVASSGRVADRLKELALEARPQGLAALHFHNLHSFARELYDEAATGWTLEMDNLFGEHVLLDLIRNRFQEARFLPRALYSRRAGASVLGLIHELKDAAVDPKDALDAVVSKELGEGEIPKLAEILSLYRLYCGELSDKKIHERSDVARIAAEFAPESRRLARYRHVLGYGFYDLVQTNIDLMKAVARRVDTTLFIPRLGGHPYVGDLPDLLGGTRRELPSAPKRAKTRVLSASGARDEVWAAAKQILAWMDEKIPLHRIGVVGRTLDPYADLIESVFRENRIPFSSSVRRSREREPLLKAARQLFTLGDFPRGAMLDLIGSPLFVKGEGSEPELWDVASRLMGIGKGEAEWRRRLGARVGHDYVYSEGERGDERRFILPAGQVSLFWEVVKKLFEAPPPPGDGPSLAVWAGERFRSFLRPVGDVKPITDALESLRKLTGKIEDPERAIQRALASISVPLGDLRNGGVQVLDAMQARCLPFDRLVVLGLNERFFPRYILEDAFVRDGVRSRLDYRLGSRMARRLEGYEEERLLFALLMGSAPEALLTYQRSDEKGRLQVPSVFLRGVATDEVLPRRPSERLEKEDLLRLTSREAALRTGEVENLARAVGRDVTLLIRATDYLSATGSRTRLTPYDGLIDAAEYWRRLAAFGLSPTALEKMAECPFRYFALKVLDLEELEEPETQQTLSPLEIGTLYHDVLEHFVKGGEAALDTELDAGFKRFEQKRSIRYPLLWESEKKKVRSVIQGFLKEDQSSRRGLKPEGVEVKLKAELPVSVGGLKSVTFRGFLDRLDLSPEEFRVIDYKRRRSTSKFKWKNCDKAILEHAAYLQLPLYYLLAEREFKRPRGSAAYYFIEEAAEGEAWRLELEADFWEHRERFEAILKNLLEGIAQGRFFIHVGNGCNHCDFSTMCRKYHLPTRLRSENDPGARSWIEFPKRVHEEEKPRRSRRTR